ncbi:uncharacterized protein N7511_003620 [Penicillium nucicola]|uniref:uncharacterized protein n=1 Tax=Penicillium nucicola TaxID=1850975 RepID=UPI002544D809|nr:uncharacterized protein N7511_003620 [Penicillium nucicola]KAJ5766004.1 hypothetical protein N7511_003620 [Penicillium nucicola]
MAGSYVKKANTPSKRPSASKASSAKRNTSILNFFQKTDTPQGAVSSQARITQFVTPSTRSPSSGRGTPAFRGNNYKKDTSEGLFLEDRKGLAKIEQAALDKTNGVRSPSPDIWGGDEEFLKDDDQFFNGDSGAKRRKVDSRNAESVHLPTADSNTVNAPPPSKIQNRSGPFIDESDSEDDMEVYRDIQETTPVTHENPATDVRKREALPMDQPKTPTAPQSHPSPPPSVRAATNNADNDEDRNFDDIEDDDLIGVFGEESRERPWETEEQEQQSGFYADAIDSNEYLGPEQTEDGVRMCPICQTALSGLNQMDITVHVNDCLDGKPASVTTSPTPQSIPNPPLNPVDTDKGLTRTERAAIARPPQPDPYSQNKPNGGSVFSKMMAGNAEDTAWVAAAASEVSSRGKQAYQRTCPFYKIMPGFSICVDAFRYGAVEGCNAYFLSHFHSDHYIGLGKNWCHGPIFCSKPTANLVRQQLRVDPKWIVDLDFEITSEVPNTGGANVTMLHANHCPGSSLFLFEKTFDTGPNSRQQRILHCGDFRASPLQVQHPLLRPDVINPVTGKPRQQRIDLCYLDTTYLSPKYAFPDQQDVITACEELCVRLDEEAGVGLDSTKSPGGLMSKFLSTIPGSKPRDQATKVGGRLLVVIGTYSIGKERICMGIAKALGSKIFATPPKRRICACLEDPELSELLTDNPHEAQVHMQTLFEIRADTLADYLDTLKPHFSRVVGFRPTGWTYRSPAGRTLQNPPVPTVLHGEEWKTSFTSQSLTPQRGSTRESACYGVPYSEHSSFRELTMFCCSLRIGRVIPTVNVGNQKAREVMKAWIERWEVEKKKNGLFQVEGDRW